MKLKLGNSIALSMVAILFISMMAIFPVHASTPNIYMTPSVNPPLPGPYVSFLWNITVWVTGYTGVFAWQVSIKYDQVAGINCTRVWVADFRADYIFVNKLGTRFPVTSIDVGIAKVGDSLLTQTPASSPPDPDPASLAIFEFEILKAPGKGETLTTALNIDNVDTFLVRDVDLDNDGYLDKMPRTATNGVYTWAWQPPSTKPNVAVQPSSVEFGSSPRPTGRAFDVNVVIENLDVDWGLTEANVTIAYNATVIDIVGEAANVTIDSNKWSVTKLAVNYNVDPAFDNITIHVKSIGDKGESPPKDELIATIKFTVMYPGPWGIDVISHLDFVENVLKAGLILISQNLPVNGKFVIRGMTIEVRFPPFTFGQNNFTTNKLQTFNVEVWLNDLTADKNMIGVQFGLLYNSTLLQLVQVTEGPFLPSFNNTYPAPYTIFTWFDEPNNTYVRKVLVGDVILADPVKNYTVFPEGSGLIATITFQGIYRGFYPERNFCTLGLADIFNEIPPLFLIDDKGNPITTTPMDGYYEIYSYRQPVAAFTYTPSVLNANVPVVFNASASHDFDLGYIVSYRWDFGDGNTITVNQPIVEHVYKLPGTYNVNLTVTDDDGQTNSIIESINVQKRTSTISMSTDAPTIVLSQSTIISGAISPALASVDVTIQYRLQGETEWKNLKTTPTDNEGKYSYTWTPDKVGTFELRANWLGNDSTESATSDTITLTVNALANVAIKNVSLSATTVYAGWSVKINVTVKNEGMTTETFDVSVYYNGANLIGTKTVLDLSSGTETTLTFVWNTTSALEGKNYQISAYVAAVPNELDLSDNTFVFGYLIKIKIMGDINGDDKVDITDINIISLAFGSSPGHPRWDTDADITGPEGVPDGKVDLFDLAIALGNFGKTSTP